MKILAEVAMVSPLHHYDNINWKDISYLAFYRYPISTVEVKIACFISYY